mgnify:CR=1 FL=1
MSRTLRLTGALALAATLGACDSSSGPNDQGSQVSLAVATRTAGIAPVGMQASGGPVEYNDGTNTLIITQVEMVVKEKKRLNPNGSIWQAVLAATGQPAVFE